MKNKKVTSMFLSCALGFCVLFGYGSTSSAAETQQNTSTEEDNQRAQRRTIRRLLNSF